MNEEIITLETNMSFNKAILLSLFFVFFGWLNNEASAQIDQDFWLGYGVSFKPIKKTTLSIEAQQRFEIKGIELEQNLIEIELERKLSKLSKLGLIYRSTWEKEEEHRIHRYAGYYKLGYSKGRFNFSNRLGPQFDVTNYTGETQSNLRNKVRLEYDLIKKVKPYIAYDVSYRFDNRNYIDNHRFYIGNQFKIKKSIKLNTFIRFDHEVNRNNPEDEIIYGVKFLVKI